MATPHNAPYKVEQRKAKKAYRNRGRVLWRSCVLEEAAPGQFVKHPLQGTRIGSFR